MKLECTRCNKIIEASGDVLPRGWWYARYLKGDLSEARGKLFCPACSGDPGLILIGDRWELYKD